MSSAAQPKTKTEAISGLLQDLFMLECAAREFEPFKVARIQKMISELAKDDRIKADVYQVALQTVLCNYDEARAAAQNILANGDAATYSWTMAKLESNFLFGSAAHEALGDELMQVDGIEFNDICESAAAVGAFRTVLRAVEIANAQQRVIGRPSVVIPLSRRAVPVLDHFGITDAYIAACVDQAGIVLRERKLLWLRNKPDLFVSGMDSDEPGIAIEYLIAATPEEATAMNNQLVDLLIEADLAKPGFTLGFTGVLA